MPPPLLAQATSYIQVHPFPKCDFIAFITSSFSLFNHLVPRLTAPTSSSLSVALRDHQLIQHETPLTNAKLCNLFKLCPTICFAQVLNLGHERNSAGGSLVLNYIDRLQVFVACQRSLFNCSFSSIAHKLGFLHTLVLEANTELSEHDFVAMGKCCKRLKHLNLQYSIGEYTDWVTKYVLSPSSASSSSFSGGSWETIEEFMWTPIGTSASFKPNNLRKIFKYCQRLRILEISVPFGCEETRSLFEPSSSQENCDKLEKVVEEEEHFGHLVNLEQFCFQNLQFSNGMLNTIGSHLHRVKAVLAAGGNISDAGVFDLLQNRKISDCSSLPTYNFNFHHHLLELDLSTQDDFMITSSYSRRKFRCQESEEFAISDSAVNAICENLIFLKRLILKGRKSITSDGLNNLKKLIFLEELNVSGTAVSRTKDCLTDISTSIRELYMTDIMRVPKTGKKEGATDDGEGEEKLNNLLQIDDLLEEFISRGQGRCCDVEQQHLSYIRFHEECLTERTRGLVEKAQSLIPSFKYFYIDGSK